MPFRRISTEVLWWPRPCRVEPKAITRVTLSERKLRELADLTREMLELSRGGDWHGVSLLEEQRQAVMAARDRGPMAEGVTARQRLEEINAANAAIVHAAVAARDEVRREMDGVAKGSRAVSAYGKNLS